MLTLLCVYLLGTLDCAFCGIRAAVGFNALIDKRRYYAAAAMRAAGWGQIAILSVLGAGALSLFMATSPDSLAAEYEQGMRRFLQVVLPYALVVLTSFAARAIPNVDIRSISSVVVFGPATLLRPFVVVTAVLWGCWPAQSVAVWLLGAVSLAWMLGFEYLLTPGCRARGRLSSGVVG